MLRVGGPIPYPILLSDGAIVLLCYCAIALLCYCAIVLLRYCAIALLRYCAIVLLCCCAIVLLCYCAVVLLCYCAIVSYLQSWSSFHFRFRLLLHLEQFFRDRLDVDSWRLSLLRSMSGVIRGTFIISDAKRQSSQPTQTIGGGVHCCWLLCWWRWRFPGYIDGGLKSGAQ